MGRGEPWWHVRIYSVDLISGTQCDLSSLLSSSMSKIRSYLNSEATKPTEDIECTPKIPWYTSDSQYVGKNSTVYWRSQPNYRVSLQNDSEWHAARGIFKNLQKASKICFDSFLKLVLSLNVTNTSQVCCHLIFPCSFWKFVYRWHLVSLLCWSSGHYPIGWYKHK